MTKARSHKIELVKRGRRTYGGIYTLPSGDRVYLAHRRLKEIFRSGEKTISDAIRKGVASWAMDDETLGIMRSKGIEFVGVKLRETEDVWITRLEYYRDTKFAKIMNFESRGGALQRYLPLSFFRHKPGKRRGKL